MTRRCASFVASAPSNRHSSTLLACSEKRAKLTPAPSQIAPNGYDRPGQTRMKVSIKPVRARSVSDGCKNPSHTLRARTMTSIPFLHLRPVDAVLGDLGGDAA